MSFARYAIFYTPPPGPLADFGAAWLGWDPVRGRRVQQLQIESLDLTAITKIPRKYGFHGTFKPPFALAGGQSEKALSEQFDSYCKEVSPVTLGAMKLVRLGSFLALTPAAADATLSALAADVVEKFDGFRAPMGTEELARRRVQNLTPAQDDMLLRWGYPYLMQDFRFHLTLTGKMPSKLAADVQRQLEPLIAPLIATPFKIDALSLLGEDDEGRFHLIASQNLSG